MQMEWDIWQRSMDDAPAIELPMQALVPTNHEFDLTWVRTLTLVR